MGPLIKAALAIGTVFGGWFLYERHANAKNSPSVTPANSLPLAANAGNYSSTTAIQVNGTSPVTVALSSSVMAFPIDLVVWNSSVQSSDTTILTPSIPGTTNGFVAIGRGTTTLSGQYGDSAGVTRPFAVAVTVK